MVVESTRLSAAGRRSAILVAARHEFARRGFRGASTAAIAAGAGCSEPTLYKHFPSKQALFAAVLTDATEAMGAKVRALIAESSGPMAGMVAIAEHAATDPLIVEIIRLRMLAASLVDEPDVHVALAASLNDVIRGMAANIAAGQAAGEVRDDVDPTMAAWIWYGFTLAGGHAHALHGHRALPKFAAGAAMLGRLLGPPAPSPEEAP
jgi:TetR/AcrR family transcriptional regulator